MPRSFLPRLCTILLASTAVSCLGLSTTLGAPAGSMLPLQFLPSGTVSDAMGISGDGRIIIGRSDTGTTYWTADGVGHDLGIGSLIPYGINYDGSIIVGTNQVTSEAFVYRDGTLSYLPVFFDPVAQRNAMDVNADGSVIVGTDRGTDGNFHAVLWNWNGTDYSTITDLGLLTPGGYSGGNGINESGTIAVGSASTATFNDHAFYWQAGVMHDLGTSGVNSSATAISGDGSVIIGRYGNNVTSDNAVSWSGAGFVNRTDLGNLGAQSYATAINRDGTVIVGASRIDIATSETHAFRYADGTMSDLNTLLTGAGVNMSGVVLGGATGVSADGLYIAAQNYDPLNYQGFLVYYNPLGGAGLTNKAEQQASVDGLGKQRQALAIQHDAYAGILTGDLDRNNQSNDVGVFGLVGSVVGGVHGHLGLGQGFSFSGGLMDGTSSFGGADIGNGFLGAAALRYDSEANLGGFNPYAQVGGSFGVLSNVSFTRDYVGGTGVGTTDGKLASLYARLGVTRDFETGDQISLQAEIGNRWLSTEAYSESFSATNPFPATIAAGADRQTVGKLGGSWTHPLSDAVDVTLHAALGATLAGSSGLSVAAIGLGTMTTGTTNPIWGEFGAHADWAVTENSSLDLYATAITGRDIGTNAHVGAGYRYKF